MGRLIAEKYKQWKAECNERFRKLKANEEELNRIFIAIYGLQDELTPDVADKDVTVHCVFDTKEDVPESLKGSNYVRTKHDEIISLISYAVGCIFGRYSVDTPGLCYAGGEWDAARYQTIVPAADNVVPICDDDYWEGDLTDRIIDFVRLVYGEDTLTENLKFIANALETKGASPREAIRNYLLTDFYADHCKAYRRRPIYWMFRAGKKQSFQALVYMHRWRRDTVACVRTSYVHELQARYRTQITGLQAQLNVASPSERAKRNKQLEKLRAQYEEITAYEEKLHHFADQMLDIDLDDGVKVNYAKMEEILEKIK